MSRSGSRKTLFRLTAILLSLAAGVAMTEIALRLFYPQESLLPRWAFSPEYCSSVYPWVRMVHERAGRWKFIYTINEDGYRGPRALVSSKALVPTVIVLGDSYTFGAGVNDGEEYAAVLGDLLQGAGRVVNLGVGGWGLTQEIRRFYDFGIRFAPSVVVLQSSANDPQDDLRCPVTEIVDGRFSFHDSHRGIFSIQKILSRSIIQRSHLYNLVRDRLYRLAEARRARKARASLESDRPERSEIERPGSPEELEYVQLLELFVRDLHARQIGVIVLTVNSQLRAFPRIAGAVERLEGEGLLHFCDAADWLKDGTYEPSPEGHLWGARAHHVIGERLAEVVRGALAESRPAPAR